jgi:hypothetical protein
LLAGELDVDAAVAELPDPLTEEERATALREHAERYARGEFRTYQISRPDE